MIRTRDAFLALLLSLLAAALLQTLAGRVNRSSALGSTTEIPGRQNDPPAATPDLFHAPEAAPRPRRHLPPEPPLVAPLVAPQGDAGNAGEPGAAIEVAGGPDQGADTTVALAPDGRVEGRVLALPYFTPVANAFVHVWRDVGESESRSLKTEPWSGRNETRTKEDGTFSFEGPAGDVELLIRAPDRPPHRLSVRLIQGGVAYVEPVLHEGATITGHALRPDGTPLRGQLVSARGAGGRHLAVVQCDGRFEIRGLPGGELELSLFAGCKGALSPPETVHLPEGGRREVELRSELAPGQRSTWSSPAIW